MPCFVPRRLVAVDVETANTDLSSICAVAVVEFQDGRVRSKWDTFVDPQDVFSSQHVDLHGIDEAAVRGAPTWDRVSDELRGLLLDRAVVSHTLFDRTALLRASAQWQVDPPVDRHTCTWLDSCAMARSAWPRLANHRLQSICELLSYPLRHHHDARDDAKAAGHVLFAAMNALGFESERLLEALAVTRTDAVPVTRRASVSSTSPKRDGVPDVPLAGEIVVFAGDLSLGPSVTADLAKAAGCSVADNVSGLTTMLVEGRLQGHRETRKQRRAREVSADVRSEREFMDLLGLLR
jgi:DNA polymerase-3 subunit epsilon